MNSKAQKIQAVVLVLLVLVLVSSVVIVQAAEGKRPLIGITSGMLDKDDVYDTDFVAVRESYAEAILAAGGMPVILYPTGDRAVIADLVKDLDGLLLTGGEDINPLYYGEEPQPELRATSAVRDSFEIPLTQEFYYAGKPIMAVCRGVQVLNVALEGKLYQDIGKVAKIKHNQETKGNTPTHWVTIDKDSNLAKIMIVPEAVVNSFHHQAIKEVAPGFRAVAWAKDGIVEAIEAVDGRAVFGVQWHPERLLKYNDEERALFSYLVKSASKH